MNEQDFKPHSNPDNYSENSFWQKIKNVAKKAGKKVIVQALELYYVAQDKDTPSSAKTIIYGGLAYFILPVDLVPDFLGLIGFTDDLAALSAVWQAVNQYAKPEHSRLAEEKWAEWF